MNNPRQFVVQLGSLISLYVSISSLLFIIFGVITVIFPDSAAYYYEDEGARSSIRAGIAALLVFFPAYLALTRVSNVWRRKETGGKYTPFAKWMVYISLLLGGIVMLADLVSIILSALEGELTQRFLLKASSLFLVVGLAMHYYILDVRGYFKNKVDVSMYFGMGATVLVLAALSYGFAHIETPAKVREMRIDESTVRHLEDVRWQIDDKYRTSGQLPADNSEIKFPPAPEGRKAYEYRKITDTTYELCAEFASATPNIEAGSTWGIEDKNFRWDHEAGWQCFERYVEKVQ